MRNSRKRIIDQFNRAKRLGQTLDQLAATLGIKYQSLRTMLAAYRRQKLITGHLISKRRYSARDAATFVKVYTEAVEKHYTYNWVANKLDKDKNYVKCRRYQLRREGHDLPELRRAGPRNNK